MEASGQGGEGVIFADDRRVIVIGISGYAPDTITWWDMAKREELFNEDESSYAGLLFTIVGSQNGTVLATAGEDYTARAWDIRTSRELKRLPYMGGVTVALSPDGKLFASTGTDPSVDYRYIALTRLWPEDLIESTCAQVSRNLTPEEWHEYFYDAPYRRTCPGIEEEQKRK